MAPCKKCENPGTVLLRKKDFYCENCFIASINHKFRACIGKNKVLSANENVLVCLSGGHGSTAMLDLIYNGLSLNNHKKLWITPFFLHIMGKEKGVDDVIIADAVKKQCSHYKFDIHISHISEYVLKDSKCCEESTLTQFNSNAQKKLESLLETMSVSSKNDFLLKAIRHLFIKYAKKLECKYIFTAETSGTLAINLLSNLTNGRGSQVQYDIGFCDNRNEVNILRPIRDISQEELQYYMKIKLLMPHVPNINANENSLQAVIKNFVTDLQENFQSTISTVCKTADKIGIHNRGSAITKCSLCESSMQEHNSPLTALEATIYSRTVSSGKYKSDDEDQNSTMFPHVNKSLCYTCSRHFSEMDQSRLPLHISENVS